MTGEITLGGSAAITPSVDSGPYPNAAEHLSIVNANEGIIYLLQPVAGGVPMRAAHTTRILLG
ncbi:MAG TPA: hypothetical protein VF171_04005 [Trueperaceae bacterium]